MIIYLNRSNSVDHELLYTESGKTARQAFNLSTATEIIIEFLKGSAVRKTLSSLSHPGITVLSATEGRVRYRPQSTDFNSVADYQLIDGMRWVVKSSSYPDGVVFGTPPFPVEVRKS
jgi:hypothetical protein